MASTQDGACPIPDVTDSGVPHDHTLVAILRHAICDPAQRVTVIGGLFCLVLFGILFRDSLWHFAFIWRTDDNYSHGFLVPFLSLYFASQVAHRGPVPVRSGVLVGGSLLGAAIVGRLLTVLLPIPFLADLALLLGLAGIFALLLGAEALRRYWFVFFFLVFMVPLPVAMYSRIASPLQLLASQVASTVMNATGVPVLREGNRMTLPGGAQLFVAEACSGMRQLTGFLALTAAVAYLTLRPLWYKAIVVLSALPIALTANVARVVLTGYIMHFLNPQYASGTYHTLEGMLLMGFGLLLLNSVCSLLSALAPNPLNQETTEAPEDSVQSANSSAGLQPAPGVLSEPVYWNSRGLSGNLMPLRVPEELP
jgi:exosortase